MAEDITILMQRAGAGDRQSAEALLPLVYDQLRKVAQERMSHERRDHTLVATALVHEAYARLVGSPGSASGSGLDWANRAHFFHAAAEAMRRILIEHARARGRVKRGGEGGKPAKRVPLNVLDLAQVEDSDEIVAVDDAIRRLEASDPTAGAVVRLRFYAGLSVEDTARALGISERTVMREWAYAKAVLFRELEAQTREPSAER
ncbi:MAG: sigma-70 family RNA polymerase sigma factor [Tepidisphaera sp.]|jgi:RNA polymerase sigma factor (TIGR02999 family)